MKLDIFKKQWIDLVFEGRNKSYGAYELRTENPKTTVKALIIGALIFSGALSAPLISKYISTSGDMVKNVEAPVMSTLIELPPPPVDDKPLPPPPPPPPAEATKSINDVKKFVKPVVVKKEQVTEEIAKIEDLKTADVGKKDIKGDKLLGEIKIDEPIGLADKGKGVTDDNEIHSMGSGLEVKPDFPGGMAKFYAYVAKNFRTPEVSSDLKGRVIVNFVVEKDGSLSDIKVVRDLGFGTGKEAIRLLKASPKWSPGIQNGRPVRVLYSLPIVVDVKS
ncbi:energy transducer TonB [Flavobacterium sp. '19STA2R22 D10 B1']|uniref:energy transducer TonB n=1 Tax=Flavobacterium aerium TaxID=3037261 RepID=UPI00278C4907|nr:energy transducer TonB [Flavobacterium sp. '19STA2R22 D10 B1']